MQLITDIKQNINNVPSDYNFDSNIIGANDTAEKLNSQKLPHTMPIASAGKVST